MMCRRCGIPYLRGMDADSLAFPQKRSRLLGQVLLLALGLALSALILMNVEVVMMAQLRLTVFFAALIGSICCGYLLLVNVFRMNKSEPLLKADAEGLWFHASGLYYGKVLWSDIKGYEVGQYGWSKMVLIRLKDPEAFAGKYQDIRRFSFRRMLKRYGTPVALPAAQFEADAAEMLGKISAYGKGRA
jgi:hypothetical protein